MIKLYTILFFSFSALTTVSAQAPSNVTQSTQWNTINTNIGITRRWTLMAEANARFADGFHPMQHELIVGADFTVNKHFSFTPFGYAGVLNFKYGKQPAGFINEELRLWQRVQYKHRVGVVALGHRLMIEERSIQRHHADSQEPSHIIDDGFINKQTRYRYRLNAVIPLSKNPGADHFYYANINEEIFYSKGDLVMHHKIAQTRLFAGVGYQFTRSAALQAGYIYQYIRKDNGTQSENNMGFMLQFNYGFSLFKQK